ncbi:dickkopf-related protein 3 isoform X2 [Rhinatrema bivittatum]|uniref:dickkopf-related protein 3 isoform X2 n=1 Tax=Rhinatrema bivittatum TaxID=194408 RepID=UPI0011299033|nr:dickkopf-related protein 3 isoform X2 [Rhinatrema bivittatum]
MLRSALLVLSLALGAVHPSPAGDREDEEVVARARAFSPEKASLNELFREVGELVEDTQHKLQNAVKEMEAEESAAKKIADVNFEKLPPTYHNESNTETKIGNKTIHTHQEIDKLTDNKTGSTIYSETVITSIKGEDGKRNHECIIDEDCDDGKYCQLASFEYKCLKCKTQDACSRDGECCGAQLCVWGQCTKAVSKGENGTICESQRDCSPGLCCAFQTNLLFPVCTPLPIEGEFCHDPSSKLLDLLTWQVEPDGVLDRCPCANGLSCQLQSHGLASVCEQLLLNGTEDNELEIPLAIQDLSFLDAPDELDADTIIQEVNQELTDFDRSTSEQMDIIEPNFVPGVSFEDEI